MQQTYVEFLSPKTVKYTLNGKNLAEMRRAELQRLLAKPLGVESEGAKNDILKRIIARLNALEAPTEITDLEKFSEAQD